MKTASAMPAPISPIAGAPHFPKISIQPSGIFTALTMPAMTMGVLRIVSGLKSAGYKGAHREERKANGDQAQVGAPDSAKFRNHL